MLLSSESADEFEQMRESFFDELQPEGSIETWYVKNVAYHTWEVLRYRRAKAEINNAAQCEALENLLKSIGPSSISIRRLVRGWSEDKQIRAEGIKILQANGLDESTVAAEAFRLRADDIERCDKLETLAEGRLEKDLRFLNTWRKKLGARLRRRTEQILDQQNPSTLVPDQEAAS